MQIKLFFYCYLQDFANVISGEKYLEESEFTLKKSEYSRKSHFFCIFLRKNLVMSKKSSTFAPAFEK